VTCASDKIDYVLTQQLINYALSGQS